MPRSITISTTALPQSLSVVGEQWGKQKGRAFDFLLRQRRSWWDIGFYNYSQVKTITAAYAVLTLYVPAYCGDWCGLVGTNVCTMGHKYAGDSVLEVDHWERNERKNNPDVINQMTMKAEKGRNNKRRTKARKNS